MWFVLERHDKDWRCQSPLMDAATVPTIHSFLQVALWHLVTPIGNRYWQRLMKKVLLNSKDVRSQRQNWTCSKDVEDLILMTFFCLCTWQSSSLGMPVSQSRKFWTHFLCDILSFSLVKKYETGAFSYVQVFEEKLIMRKFVICCVNPLHQ